MDVPDISEFTPGEQELLNNALNLLPNCYYCKNGITCMMAHMVTGFRQVKQLKAVFEEYLPDSNLKEAKLKWARELHNTHLSFDDIFQQNRSRGLCQHCKYHLKNIKDWWNLVKGL